MFYYAYYGYLVYNAYRYSYILEYGYRTIHYAGKVYNWAASGVKTVDSSIDTDWVLCENEKIF